MVQKLKKSQTLKRLMLSSSLLALSFLLSACFFTATFSAVNEPFRKTLNLTNQLSDLTGEICNYGPTDFRASGLTQIKTSVEGFGTRPESVEVTRALGSQPASAPLPSVTIDEGWQAKGNGLNCSILNCPSGSYSVALKFKKNTSCPASVILALQIP